ncbi:MAG: hypothetical protein ABJH68_10590 [Ilumatobacter sp.]|uniref:hypothetical protein n=1 Tax=Ilumatobacter sp. TaxID=1967498 RepID=UPI0032977372
MTDHDETARSPGERAEDLQPPSRTCSCGVADVAPWRQRDTLWSPASAIAGVLTVALLVVLLIRLAIPWLWLTFGATVSVGLAVSARASRRSGHRSTCLAVRSLWRTIAAIGLPLRVGAGLPF